MDYAEAIRLAKAGEEKGFTFLYEETYKSKFYFAVQYMKNEEAAQDVLQDAYLKAFSKLDTLETPEAFPGWLGKIVANTAKNALVKKNPLLFSDIAAEEENAEFEYQIEDDRLEYQPETAYTKQETQQMVHELMDTLSEEQRVCVLMFHIEGMSIKEIAAELGCSENTVKSRLKYGRDHLKIKAEDLRKKGYKLYSIAPIPLLLYLLRTEAVDFSVAASFSAELLQSTSSNASASAGAQQAVHGSIQAAKGGFLHTVAGKVTAAVVGLCVVSGAAFYGVSQMNSNDQAPVTEVIAEPESATEALTEQIPETEVTEEQEETAELPTVKELEETDYETLIAGNLTKEELQFVLAYGPTEIPEQGFQDSDYTMLLNMLCCSPAEANKNFIADYGVNNDYQSQYSVTDVNRMFSSFTTYQFTEENDNDAEAYGINVDGDMIKFIPATSSVMASTVITSAQYTEQEIEIYFTYEFINSDMLSQGMANETIEKKAVLHPDETGMYRIAAIEKVESAANESPEQLNITE